MTLSINIRPGRTVNGGGLGILTSSGNPWAVPDALANELVNRGVAIPVDWPAGATTRAALVALADAGGLSPGATYATADGELVCYAMSPRLLQPLSGRWYQNAIDADVGASTSAIDLDYCWLPPFGNNSEIEIDLQGEVTEGGTNAKRLRLVLAGTLGGGTSGSQAIWTRSLASNTDQGIRVKAELACKNDTNLLQGLTAGDSASFGITSSDFVTISGVNMGTAQLLRVMGDTSLASGGTAGTPFEGAKAVTLSRYATDVAQAAYNAHGLTTGRWVAIAGAGDTAYNKTAVQVTVIDANTFQYAAVGITATPAGSPTWQQYSAVLKRKFKVSIFQKP